jgi:ABC-2 type transport system permease protein
MKELRFLFALWKTNLLAAMEYRISFISQVVGMMLNDGIYCLFWVIFFDRFKEIRGWGLSDMFVLFGVVAAGFGLGAYLFGNTFGLADLIAKGSLDYFLSFPRPVLLHTLASRCVTNGIGDLIYGILSFLLARQFTPGAIGRFILGTLLAMIVFLSFMVAVQSLTFWMGNAQMLSQQALNAMVTFSLYPINLFEGGARFLLFTIIPAAFLGAVPAEFVRSFTWKTFAQLLAAAGLLFGLAVLLFHRGLRRYESGSAIQIQI